MSRNSKPRWKKFLKLPDCGSKILWRPDEGSDTRQIKHARSRHRQRTSRAGHADRIVVAERCQTKIAQNSSHQQRWPHRSTAAVGGRTANWALRTDLLRRRLFCAYDSGE